MSSEKKNFHIIPVVLVGIGILLIGGAAIFLLVPGLSNIASAPSNGQAMLIPYPQIKRVSVDDAREGYEQGSAIIVDVRGEPYYSEKHIKGALSIPERDLMGSLEKLDQNAWIITYCT